MRSSSTPRWNPSSRVLLIIGKRGSFHPMRRSRWTPPCGYTSTLWPCHYQHYDVASDVHVHVHVAWVSVSLVV